MVSVIPACYQFVKKLCQLLASANIDRIFPHSVQIWENTDQKTLNTDAFHAVQVTKDFIQSVQNFSLSKNSLIRKSKNYTLLATSSKHVNHDSIRNFVCSKTSYGIITIISWNPELTTNLTKMYLAKHSKNLRIRTNSSYRLAIQWKYTRAYNTASRYCNCFWKLYIKVKILQST